MGGNMATHEGEPAGCVGAIVPIGDDFGFVLFDSADRSVSVLVFHTEEDARHAAKVLQGVVERAVAVTV